MNKFCPAFCMNCDKCKKAWEEVQREEAALSDVEGPLYVRTEEEKAALDCHGQP